MELFVNPLHEGLQNKIGGMWHEATLAKSLAPYLDYITHIVTLGSKSSVNDIPWINDQMKWLAQTSLAQTSAFKISELGQSFLTLSLPVYAASLVVRELQHLPSKGDGDVPDINSYAIYAKQLAESATEEVPKLIKEIKHKERDMKSTPSHHRPVYLSFPRYIISLTQLLHFFPRFWG